MDLSEVCNSNAATTMSEATLEATIDLESGDGGAVERVDERDEVMTEFREGQRASLPSRASASLTGMAGIGGTVAEPPCVPDVEGATAILPSLPAAMQSEQYQDQNGIFVQNDVVNSEGAESAKPTTVYGYTKPEVTESVVSACSSLEVNPDGNSSEVGEELHASENLSESVVNETDLVADEDREMLVDVDEKV